MNTSKRYEIFSLINLTWTSEKNFTVTSKSLSGIFYIINILVKNFKVHQSFNIKSTSLWIRRFRESPRLHCVSINFNRITCSIRNEIEQNMRIFKWFQFLDLHFRSYIKYRSRITWHYTTEYTIVSCLTENIVITESSSKFSLLNS